MEPILLYGFPAGSSMGLVAAFERVGQPYRLCRVDMLTEMKNDAYASINGRQETPVLITDKGRVLTETMAIAAWLEARDGERRISFEPRSPEADRMHQLMAFVNTGFTAAFSPLWVAFEMAAAEPELKATLRDFGRKAVTDRHDKLEAMIADTDFLVGDRLTLADTTLIGVARWAEFHQAVDAAAYPKLAGLRRRIEADPAVRYAQAIENGENPTGSGACLGHVPLAEVIDRFAA
ncbi:glutathione S-transferase family protein [Mesorhizobium sp. YC-39]|uniref:glutathione S-transferase family protein n=1 Tax=unclassified Mesorhizobium TaxID=325217 RepID=UPI0021E7C9FB|nr:MULTISPECIES: glutathione S-transferase family protein [unclassified Mesorhizobium]MCV3210172.1 glutathione S-transferase family protein [Mesorhizobium sp. YC-2]MCV3230702.1 glutathione S-transferase family protein [Mesorhizobium sp. YC-39]